MVSQNYVEESLKKLGFNYHGWGRGEVSELPNVLLPEEEIYEAVNGFYEGGFALLLATDIRVLLVDKKPLNYLTVEDLRFDMINEMDYSHRLIGATITIASGEKTLKFSSLNQPKLRKLIGHVQHCMAEAKKKQSSHAEGQNQHLERINQQLQSYLLAQQQQLQRMQEAQMAGNVAVHHTPAPEPIKPSPELADYLYSQSLLAQHQDQTGRNDLPVNPIALEALRVAPDATAQYSAPNNSDLNAIYNEGFQEVYGKKQPAEEPLAPASQSRGILHNPLEINPMKIAYSKLPLALRNRKFGRPSFHAHSESNQPQPSEA
jgi:hypothetical protein